MRRSHRRRLAVWFAASLWIAVQTVGLPQQCVGAPAAPLSLDAITVTAARAEATDANPSRAVVVVGSPQIESRSAQVLPDLLRGEAGIFVQQTTPGQAAPIIRGLIGSSVLTMVDGVRLNNSMFRPAPNQYFALIDPYNVERVEVVRGVSSTLYGSDAMGGVINVITPLPRFEGEQWQLRARSFGQFSSANLGRVARLSAAGGRRDFGLSAGVTHQRYDDLRAGGGFEQRPLAYDVLATDAALMAQGPQHDFAVSLHYLRHDNTPRYDELVPGFGQSQPSSSVFAFEPNDRLFVHARYHAYEPLPPVEMLTLQAAFQEINDDRRVRAFGSSSEDRERNQSRLTGLLAKATSRWDRMELRSGVEVYFDEVQSTRRSRDLETGQSQTARGRFATGSRLNSFGLFLQDEIQLTPAITLTLGGRFSYFDTYIAAADRGAGVRRDTFDGTAEGGLLVHVWRDLFALANAGRGFRVPNTFDFSTLGARPGNRFNVPNQDLGAEEMIGTDTGLRWAGKHLGAELIAFYSDYRDKIEEVPTGAVTADGRTVVQNANTNRVVLWGVESSGTAQLGRGLSLYGSCNFTWGRETLAGGGRGPADRIPPLNGRVGVTYQPAPDWKVESFAAWAADQSRLSLRDRSDPRINPRGSAGWATGNLRLSWQALRALRLRLDIENFTDEHYREHGSGIDAAGINAIAAVEIRL